MFALVKAVNRALLPNLVPLARAAEKFKPAKVFLWCHNPVRAAMEQENLFRNLVNLVTAMD